MMLRRLSPSSPAPATSCSPPISPTITHLSSPRSLTPALSVDPAVDHELLLPALPSSPALPLATTPPRTASPSSPLRESMNDTAEESTVANDDYLTLHIRRPTMPLSSLSAPTVSGGLSRILPLDPSAYSDPHLPFSAWMQSKTTLSELSHLIRFQCLQEQRRSQSRIRLHRWLVSSALSARLLRCGDLAYRTLVDCFRDDDREGFATLHNALHDVRSSCDATRRFTLLEQDLDSSTARNQTARDKSQNNFSTFMDEIPERIRHEFLTFISEIRSNPEFLASRLASLSPQELSKLASFRPSVDMNDFAVMAFGKNQSKKGGVTTTASPVERLLSFQRHDGLSALIFTVFANSSGPDSVEDMRRTDAWATACARLITEAKPGHDRLIRSVLDAFAGMRGWPVKHKLELFLMQALQAGQFLLEKPEDFTGRPSPANEKPNKPLEYAADEFFERFVKRLFSLLDSEPSIGGLPEGALEIGHAILRKLNTSKKQRHLAEFNILYRWFFCSFLPQALMYPEAHGIMAGFHISTFARERILRELATRMSHQALGTWSHLNVRQSISVMPEIKAHVENLLERFRKPRGYFRPMLVPAKAVASPKETLEVQPFIVLCPSDIKTLVYSLFPERKSSPAADKEPHKSGLMSSASSISAVSIPFRGNSTPGGDGSSILSQSVSSITSDATTSREPLLQPSEKSASMESLNIQHDVLGGAHADSTENYGRILRLACSEMSQIISEDVVNGNCHPFADRWAVLHISQDGKQLLTRMRKDTEEDEIEDDSLDSDSDVEASIHGDSLENDYHQLKSSVVKLLSEYELPKSLTDTMAFSHGKRLQSKRRQANGRRNISTREDPSVQPAQKDTNEESTKEPLPDLVIMLETALLQCKMREEFLEAVTWHNTLEQLRKLSSPSLIRDGYASLLHYFARGPRDSLGRCFKAIEEFDAWFIWLKQSQERHDAQIEDMMMTFKDLRDKMWYKTEVLTSAVYDEAKNVAIALKIMGKQQRPEKKSTVHKRAYSKNAAASIFQKSETQTLDVMAAAPEHGGPNKLADEQVEMTSRWLSQNSVEADFCKGEERIHRFCMEVDKCVNRLVGDGSYDGPVLWSSKLYQRDRDILDGGHPDLWLTGASLIVSADNDLQSSSDPMAPTSLDFAQKTTTAVKATAKQGLLRRGTNSSTWSTSSRILSIMDAPQDYFGTSSPALTIDSSKTFWSPFRSKESTQNNHKQVTSPLQPSNSKTTVQKQKSAPVTNEEKRRFLLDLKQSLTGLLLSDLGSILFNKGSETDAWFAGQYAEDCIGRKEADDKNRRDHISRRKSQHGLKSTRDQQQSSPAAGEAGRVESNTSALSTPTPTYTDSDGTMTREQARASSRTSPALVKKLGSAEFPYNTAYRLLLRKFAIHPNPFSKLQALYELKLLIEQSFLARPGKSPSRRDIPPVPASPTLGATPELSVRKSAVPTARAQNLEEAIAHVAERRSYSIQNNSLAYSSAGQTSGRVVTPPSTDLVVEALQSLFCDSNIRPKTLFRDLQYIAAFVPAQLLDRTPRGRAFWDAALAALGLKQDVVRYMVSMADKIVQDNTQERGMGAQARQQQQIHTSLTSPSDPSTAVRTPPVPTAPKYRMSDAARMFLITAKEGDAAAERELAIFYLTQPDVLPRTILPLSKPREVFKGDVMSKKRMGDDHLRSDPATMCLAQHWMEQSCKGGDEVAANFMRSRDDMARIP